MSYNFVVKRLVCAGCWWITAVIVATQEAEMRTIMV
jgi:hypothetical protein